MAGFTTPAKLRTSRLLVSLLVVLGLMFGYAAYLGRADGSVYTLYRTSALDSSRRIHVATFDADEAEKYNQENCNIVLGQMQLRTEVTVRYWCEKGRFRP